MPKQKTKNLTSSRVLPPDHADSPTKKSTLLPWLACLALLAAGIIVYWNSFQGVFLLDDYHSIVHNKTIHTLTPLWKTDYGAARPVALFTLALNYHFSPTDRSTTEPDSARNDFSGDVWGYHLVNLIVHLLAGLALFGVVRRTLLLKNPSDCPGGRFGPQWTVTSGPNFRK
jgi:hypothetical protein